MVAEATINKHANTLLSKYIILYTEKYNRAPADLNRYRDKWIFRNMYEDLGGVQAARVVEYYFKTGHPGHPVKYLGFNYDRLSQILLDLDKDEVDRLKIRKETEERVRKWEEKNGNSRG